MLILQPTSNDLSTWPLGQTHLSIPSLLNKLSDSLMAEDSLTANPPLELMLITDPNIFLFASSSPLSLN